MEIQNELFKGSLIYISIYAVMMFVLLIFAGKNATIRVTEISQEEISMKADMDGCITQIFEGELPVVQKGTERDYIVIPLDGSLASTDITVENLYLDRQIRVVLAEADEGFYKDFTVTGDKMQVTGAHFHHAGAEIHLQFDLDDVYEISTQYERNALTITLEKPYLKYDKIIVIDPATQWTADRENEDADGFSEEEIQMTWDIACKARELLDAGGVKVYFSRTEQTDSDCSMTVRLAEAVRADMLIRVEPGKSEDKEVFGTKAIYNGRFFTPGLNNAFLADQLEREVATLIQGKALKLQDSADRNQLLTEAMVPAVLLVPGYVSNDLEAILLKQEQYRGKIAEGIYKAVMSSYEREENAVE